ncbi:type I-F CRISPR-associated helicase Cas3f [Acinetobacter sp. 3657]|uniref:type I-F CRISPR-associated helicase Cas3f n=1 Tax=Acinetobacter sp. 3657 TaxID=2817764 RepID=UPI0028550B89|nr:CRISPR-associated endonuclease/helicase Cas3 [Prolinoborus sp. 3657]
MIVTFISQCEKKAIPRTRRVLDAFADRIGDNTWQTVITEDGLLAVKKLLRKTVTKNTAVSCHWIRGRRRSELMWIVGNRNKFNEQGIVPVNSTQKTLQPWKSSHLWQNLELVAIASGIAGLFHDFGKANALFQAKLDPNQKTEKGYEPYRHEWVSLKFFELFVKNKTDEGWISELSKLSIEFEKEWLNQLDEVKKRTTLAVTLESLSSFAQLIAWLIVTHHRLPIFPFFENDPPTLSHDNLSQYWLNVCDIKWNSPNFVRFDWSNEELSKNWIFPFGLPVRSQEWCSKAQILSKRAFNQMIKIKQFDWLNDPLTMHLSRLILMMTDHWYSAQGAKKEWQDDNYLAYANTDNERNLKQKLDEHNLAVGFYSYIHSRKLPQFISELPDLGFNRILERGFADSDPLLSKWQDDAVKLCKKINIRSNECGFFGINMASTGKGKTIANARMMYALADDEKGARFSIALGLRTLTTQTGDALKLNLKLDESDIATIIGSSAVQRLQRAMQEDKKLQEQKQILEDLEKTEFAMRGSESLEDTEDHFDVAYPDIDPESLLKTWFEKDPKIQKLLHAPILVSTIDYLIPATESLRGGRQVAPILRLLSSDLILDEPDEFGLADLPALARLVNWAGLLGAKVLLSSATIPSAMAFALYESYIAGRQKYQQAMLGNQTQKPIVCAWVDEFSVKTLETDDVPNFCKAHNAYVQSRIKNLDDEKNSLRKAKILDIDNGENIQEKVVNTLLKGIEEAHINHHQRNEGGVEISLGVIRFANINPLIYIAQGLLNQAFDDNTVSHFCIYHSQFTLAQRSAIEEKLDRILNRKDEDKIWSQPEIKQALQNNPTVKKHIFIVLATSVCEVGRDHDYDWAIAEPSSMRSLVQLAGRIQRHRKKNVDKENLFILNQNIRDLQNKEIAFTKPGFEGNKASNRALSKNKEIRNLLSLAQYQYISAVPSIQFIQPPKVVDLPEFKDLVTLEQTAYAMTLLGARNEKNNARLWWRNSISWSGELQRRQPFRQSTAETRFYLIPNGIGKLQWNTYDDKTKQFTVVDCIKKYQYLTLHQKNCIWFNTDEITRYQEIQDVIDTSNRNVILNYGEVSLPNQEDTQYYYHPVLGVFLNKKL